LRCRYREPRGRPGVTTGSWTGMDFLQPDDHCMVRFDGLGEAEVVFDG
jgi:2-keto-4-pentenoate hydratase